MTRKPSETTNPATDSATAPDRATANANPDRSRDVKAVQSAGPVTRFGALPDKVRNDGGLLAALLLIDRAMADAAMSADDLTRLCRRHGTVLAISADATGFGETCRQLLSIGAILPGRVDMLDLTNVRAAVQFAFPADRERDWSLLVQSLDDPLGATWGSLPSDLKGKEVERRMIERYASAIRSGHPIFVLGRTKRMLPIAQLSATCRLDGGPIDAGIIGRAIEVVTGIDRSVADNGLVQLASEGVRLHTLPLEDITFAIRPGLPLDTILTLLERSARYAARVADEEAAAARNAADDDDDDEGGGSGDGSGKDYGDRHSNRDLRSWAERTASDLPGNERRSGRPPARPDTNAAKPEDETRPNKLDAGSVVIHPEPLPDSVRTDATDRGHEVGSEDDRVIGVSNDTKVTKDSGSGDVGNSMCSDGDGDSVGDNKDGSQQAPTRTPFHRCPLTIETMAGLGKARDWALDLKTDLEAYRAGEIAWEEMSTRLLLSGPPGTGKTSFARALCNTLQLPLHVASVQTWLEPSYLGSVLKRMSAAFQAAEAAAPVIFFIDETDAIGTRGPASRDFSDYWNAIVNRMLELMDGAVKTSGVIIVGATNRPEVIDPALTRSGRWERQIALKKPDRTELMTILAHHLGDDLQRIKSGEDEAARARSQASLHSDEPDDLHGPDEQHEPDVTPASPLDCLSRRMLGLTGADVERVLREARGRARRARRPLTLADLEAVVGSDRKELPEGLRRRMAIHEAGHAIVGHVLKLGRVIAVSIEDAGGGFTASLHEGDDDADEGWLMGRIAQLLGGRVAEEIVLGTIATGGGGVETSDLALATRVAVSLETAYGFGSDRPLTFRSSEWAQGLLLRGGPLADRVEERLRTGEELARTTIEANQPLLTRLADALLAAGTLDADEIAAILGVPPDNADLQREASGDGTTREVTSAGQTPIGEQTNKNGDA
ncbi:AAA family ATPase [Fulvimarina endophytica]|uniref:AAA family ATPase n=1 Tax=Fulvimarina endophytica TaxID=2293836 RepID=UPI0013145814|nr:AAA family ATPase [Fulvimarina endophytica]